MRRVRRKFSVAVACLVIGISVGATAILIMQQWALSSSAATAPEVVAPEKPASAAEVDQAPAEATDCCTMQHDSPQHEHDAEHELDVQHEAEVASAECQAEELQE